MRHELKAINLWLSQVKKGWGISKAPEVSQLSKHNVKHYLNYQTYLVVRICSLFQINQYKQKLAIIRDR